MPRLLMLLTTFLILSAAALSLQSCKDRPEPAAAPVGSSRDIVVLADGATIVARPGTEDRAMAEWIESAKEREVAFTLRTPMFVQGSARMTSEGLGDAATLATILDATPDARIAIVGRSDEPLDTRLAAKRAEALATFLEERGLSEDRWQIASKSDEPAAASQLLLIARRGSALTPFETASR